jgi:hypothetical protein
MSTASPAIERPKFNRKHRTQAQRRADHDLALHAYRIELVGRPGSLDWPSICANCGANAGDRLTVRKVFGRPRSFYRRYGTYRRQIIAAVDVPYCAECAARHRALVQPRSLVGDLWRMLWPVLIPMLGAAWFLKLTLGIAFEEQARGGMNAKYVWGLPALFAFILIWCLVIAWWSSRAARVEKQTEVTLACDFSDDVSWLWERERRIYALRDERFARAFADANADRAWTFDDDERSHRIFTTGVAAAGVVGVAVWAFVVFVL